jgi:Leucine-rich repeat (LRR) protein
MKRTLKSGLLCVLCGLIVFCAGCSTAGSAEIPAQKQETFSFETRAIQPIEAYPVALPMGVSSRSGLHRVDAQRPEMGDMTSSDDVIAAVLESAAMVAELKSDDLLNNSHLEGGDQQVTQSISGAEEYLEILFRMEDTEQDDQSKDMFREFSGGIAVDGLSAYVFSTGAMEDSATSAILVKHRFSGDLRGFSTTFYNGSISVSTGVSSDYYLYFSANQDFIEYGADSRGEYTNSLNLIADAWYFTLAALDGNYGYRYMTWQENDPSNHAFYACDLGAIFKPYDLARQQDMRAGVNYFTQTNEISVDIASLRVYAFEQFKDTHYTDPYDGAQTYTFANDDEKYQLGVQLFEAEDYFNAYTLFSELSGYDTSDYLAECKRLLNTVEIDNQFVAEKIKKAMKENGMPIYAHLYTYQAEKLESLDLSESVIDDLGFISSFSNLKTLNLESNAIHDLTPLKDLLALEQLLIGKNHVSDIGPLKYLSNLRTLTLDNNLLEDVSDLNSLTNLTSLDLSTNRITSIEGLDNLRHLESLNLSYNMVPSVSVFENAPIKTLNIMNTDINDLGEVANFADLESLYAGFRYVWKGNELYLLTKEYEMDYHFFDGISGLEALSGHQHLRKLYLAKLNTESLAPLATMPNLESLIFHRYLGADDHEVLATLVNLKELTLDSGFYHTSFLSNLTRLEKLSIETFCYVEDLSVISGLENLQELRMHQYGEDLSFLSGLKNLRLLQLVRWNGIEDYSPLLALDNLEYLDLIEMAVNDLSVISQIENLRYLRIDGTEINHIKDVGQLKKLEYFSMRWPRITGDYDPESFGLSLFDGLDHLQFAAMHAGAQIGLAYDIGDPEYVKIIEEPGETGVEFPEYDRFWVGNMADLQRLETYAGSQNLIIDGLQISETDTLTIRIPKSVRRLFISSSADYRVNIALECGENEGLERISIGNTFVGEDYNGGMGEGSFFIENLDGLTGCRNLREIYTDSTQINDRSGLERCEKLKVVAFN